jgi:hypothetical protein
MVAIAAVDTVVAVEAEDTNLPFNGFQHITGQHVDNRYQDELLPIIFREGVCLLSDATQVQPYCICYIF